MDRFLQYPYLVMSALELQHVVEAHSLSPKRIWNFCSLVISPTITGEFLPPANRKLFPDKQAALQAPVSPTTPSPQSLHGSPCEKNFPAAALAAAATISRQPPAPPDYPAGAPAQNQEIWIIAYNITGSDNFILRQNYLHVPPDFPVLSIFRPQKHPL